jgi:hypothetical protein
MFAKLGQGILTYAPFGLQAAYVLLKALLKASVTTLAGDLCFAGFSFFVWGLTMNMSAGKMIAGGGRYQKTRSSERMELGWSLVILILSLCGMAAGYVKGGPEWFAYCASFALALICVRMLMPPKHQRLEAGR